jgi:hypothetical protein
MQETLRLSYEIHLLVKAAQGSDSSLLGDKQQPMDALCMH